ncbi:MAG: Rne/Rng family ribonuclease [Firmicutes bacterium]|nr:Rne/Rng family ribonuclease [Bacillota bacterium]
MRIKKGWKAIFTDGKVQNVLKGMQSAFIDIGENRNTFIRLKDLLLKEDSTKNNVETDNINIKDVVKSGDEIIIQVKRDGTDKKGARVSTHINLPGRFVVFMPGADFITVSQKITNDKEKQRLTDIIKKILPKESGAIIRTSAEKVEAENIIQDMKSLIEKWEKICRGGCPQPHRNQPAGAPALLYDNMALLRRTVIDIIDQNLNKITVNDKKTHNDIKELLKSMNVEESLEIILKENEDLFDMYDLREQEEKLKNRKIWLKCGGFITIDKTEALTAIDVNTGKYTGTSSLEQTVFNVNKEATVEIARQLRLRDIGGIIIIDYIDMTDKANEAKIIELMNESLKKDRTKCQVLGFTGLHLLEMTRKNMCNNEDF